MKRIFIFIIFCFIILTFTSCDYKDIDRRIFIVAIGVDEDDEKEGLIRLSFKAVMSKSSQDSGKTEEANTKIYSITGDSISKIFRVLKSETAREPDFSHMKLIVLGENFAKNNNIIDLVEFLIRRRDIQNLSWIALGSPSAQSILSHTLSEESIPGNNLFFKFGQGTESPYTYDMKLYKFYNSIITPGCTPSCSIFEAENDKIIMSRTALFLNGKATLILNKEETQLLNLMNNNLKFGAFKINSSEQNKYLAIGIDSSKSKIRVAKQKKDEGIVCDIKIKMEATLEEKDYFSSSADNISRNISDDMKEQINGLINKLKENKMDPLDIESRYWSNSIDFMPNEKWLTEIYPRIKFNIDPRIDINHTGTLDFD